ncbi:hypothetical protein HDU86_006198 [Geranomyces michiganensis]|nr:hypothetical protein HDU86_006198 [Geranomyces michiganensis]
MSLPTAHSSAQQGQRSSPSPTSMHDLCRDASDLSAAPLDVWKTYYHDNVSLFAGVQSGNASFFANALADGSDPLAFGVLRPDRHSLIYLHVLLARLVVLNNAEALTHGKAADGATIISYAMAFMEQFNCAHVSLAPDAMEALGNHLATLAKRLQKPILAVLPLKVGCARWAETTTTTIANQSKDVPMTNLTPLHTILCKAALLANAPTAALSILDRDITDIDPVAFGIKYQHHLLYCYYGGMIYTQLKQHARAMQLFELCVSAPGPHVSLIQIEAHRKLILVSLLANGGLPSTLLPKYTSDAVLRAAKLYSAAYADFAHAYASGSAARIDAEYRVHEAEFHQHGNRGIARQCVEAVTRRAVQRLTDTYLTLSLQDIAKSVGLATDATTATTGGDAAAGAGTGGGNAAGAGAAGSTGGADQTERLVLRMVQDGQVFAKISSRDGGMVSFRDAPQRYADAATTRRLDGEIAQAIVLASRVLKMDRSIAVNKDFASKLASAESRSFGGGGGGGGGGSGSGASASSAMMTPQIPSDNLMDADVFEPWRE